MKVRDILDVRTRYSFEGEMYPATIPAGLQLHLEDRFVTSLDLNHYLIHNPASTFFVRVHGESMIDKGIYDGDLLIVDTSIPPTDGRIVVAGIDGEMAVKTLRMIDNRPYLYSANQRYLPIEITPYMKFEIFGVALHAIHSV